MKIFNTAEASKNGGVLMRYKAKFKESYRYGRQIMSCSVSRQAWELICKAEISNVSAFVNDLILEALADNAYFKKREIGEIQATIMDYNMKYNESFNLSRFNQLNSIEVIENVRKQERY